MIITKEEQIKIINKWHTKEKSTRDLLCFLEGMEAFRQLLEDKVKVEKEQKEHMKNCINIMMKNIRSKVRNNWG